MSKITLISALFLLLIIPFHGNSQPTTTTAAAVINAQEQNTLLNLKHFWYDLPAISHWNQSSNPCTWPEITCSGNTVTGLSLINININETLPPFICDLKNLNTLILSYNEIPGPFPTVLYNCTKLQYLDLSQNYFVGTIPDDIYWLSPNLEYIDLGANNFTGDIPAAIARLSKLKTLYVYQNEFEANTFPEDIGNLGDLEQLGLAFNRFIPSPIPESFMRLKKLKRFWMTEANLIGGIPESLNNLTALEFLDLSVNNLTGDIPKNLFQSLKNLTQVYLYSNRLTGEIPRPVEALNMEIIDLSDNILTGTIPEEIGNLNNLTNLTLMMNQLSGGIPAGIGRLPKLIDIRVFDNNLSGPLPPDMGRFSKLVRFEVSNNHLNGTLPENLCFNGVLVGLVVFNNSLTGDLPKSLESCTSLEIFRIEQNQFSGVIPAGLWNAVNLSTVIASNNLLSGQLPVEVGPELSILDISNNKVSGEIPTQVSSWSKLVRFMASNNLLNGTIPEELTALSSLATLLLDGNRLSGPFPSNIISWQSLTTLNLSRNQLTGPLPGGIGVLPVLTSLDLSSNDFSGQIPSQFGRLRLTSLNLSNNRLSGTIPSDLENGAFDNSFLNNTGLCANRPSTLGLRSCRVSRSGGSAKLSSRSVAVIASISALLFIIAVLLMGYGIVLYRRRNYGLGSNWKFTSFQKLSFNETTILPHLTENNVIGSGGSGKVYCVPIKRSGECVAVKRIWNKKDLDRSVEKEFLAEVEILSKIRHVNIVKLKCCISSDNSKLLVYEYLENRSLDRWLHGKKKGSNTLSSSVRHVVLDWPKRMHIAIGAARGLSYMHHDCSPQVIHRDVKSSNVLLDSDFNAKIADFGLARILVKQEELNTMSAIAGSFGYIAPEYAHTRRVNEKIDVYSFGVILLELVTGREANDGGEHTSLAEWAWRHVKDNKPIVDALDEDIKEPFYLTTMCSVFKLGLICTSTLPSSRPTMKDVTDVLLRCSRLSDIKDKNMGSEFDSLPLLKRENV